MKKTLVLVLLFALAWAASAERILSISLDVYENDSVVFKGARIEEGRPTAYLIPGAYRIELSDREGKTVFNKSIDMSFEILTDPPRVMDYSPVDFSVRYTLGITRLDLYNRDRLIFTKELDLCNNNSVCERDYESHLSCPLDCGVGEDGVCTPGADGVCDSDCRAGLDQDCAPSTTVLATTLTTTTMPEATTTSTVPEEPAGGGMDYVIYIVVFLVVLAVVFFLYRKKASAADIEKQRQEFEKWKQDTEKPKM